MYINKKIIEIFKDAKPTDFFNIEEIAIKSGHDRRTVLKHLKRLKSLEFIKEEKKPPHRLFIKVITDPAKWQELFDEQIEVK